jgi:16S rRNA (cytosine967-C5)-methyltransferase
MPPLPTPRALALDLLATLLDRGRLLDELLDDRRLARLDERDRAFVRLLLATTLRRLGQIDALIEACLDRPLAPRAARVSHALRLGVCQLLFLDLAPHAAISTTVDLVKHTPHAGFAGLINAVLRRLARDGAELIATQDAARLNTPDWLWRSWCAAYGEDTTQAIAAAHLTEAPLDLSVAADPAGWAERLEAEILPTGSLRRPAGGAVSRLPGFDSGAWWVQDAAAALPARLLGAVGGRRVADLCAAPGGKALQLAAAGAEVTAVDRSAARLERLAANLARLGLTARVVTADAAAWAPGESFDAVLLDAPCSATGTLRRHPDVARHKSPGDVTALAATQARLLDAAAGLLAPGGVLVYCVCSMQPEEGPEQIERLLAAGAPFERAPISPDEVGGLAELITPAGELRTLPIHLADQGGMDAFFAARLRRV